MMIPAPSANSAAERRHRWWVLPAIGAVAGGVIAGRFGSGLGDDCADCELATAAERIVGTAIFAVGGAPVGGLVGLSIDQIIQNTPPKPEGGTR